MAEDFEVAVEDGLRLAKRIYFGKDRAVAPPKPPTSMDRVSGHSFLPTAPMLYAVVVDPAIVDNPDIPSYQPHVHGRCNPPALIPLQMNGVSLEVDCFLDTAFVTVTGSWRVHCVMGSKSCDCRIAVPMGEQGSILGVEVEVPKGKYCTQLVDMDENGSTEKPGKLEDGGFLKPHIFTLTIPEIDGGTNISVILKWSQKLLYTNGEYTLEIPFNFPEYVTPAAKKISKREKIRLNVNSGLEMEVLCKTTSHPLKIQEQRREVGKLGFLYESDVLSWSNSDFFFTYAITSHTSGGVLWSAPSLHDADQREMFCCCLFPGTQQSRKVFRREVVFTVDISGSMKGKPIEDTKNALFTALKKLDPADKFNVVAFNGETYLFSSSLEPATEEVIEKVTEWINLNFIAGGGTNIALALDQAMAMLSDCQKSIPVIILITDGSVEDERDICNKMKSQLKNLKNIHPRIYTLGIGTFCNHYFLRMLAVLGRGHHDAASDVDSIEVRMGRLFAKASSIFLADIAFDNLDSLDDLEVLPHQIPDLSSESPLIVLGRYRGMFPETLKIRGILQDKSNFLLELNVQEAKEIPIGKILAKQQIELMTSQAWYSKSKDLQEKVAKLSVQNAVVSEYTNMVLLEMEKGKISIESTTKPQGPKKADHHDKASEDIRPRTRYVLGNMTLAFGNLSATAENVPPGLGEVKPIEAAELFARAASNCCGKLCNNCCCMCVIQSCSKMNNQCAVVFTQLCVALACLGCYACCCAGDD